MPITKKLLPAALAALLSVSCVTAYADDTITVTEAGGSGEAAIMLSVDENPLASIFSATIPAVIPAAVDTNGLVTVPTNIEIINNNVYRGIKVTDISVVEASGWNLADYDSGDFSSVNGKNIGLTLRGDAMNASTGKVELSEKNWNIGVGETLPVPMDLKVNQQSKVGSLGTVATISFTLDWSDDDNSSTTDPVDPSQRDYYLLTFEAGEHGSLKDQATTMQIKKSDLAANGGSMSVTFPLAYADAGYAFDKWVIVNSDGSETDVENKINLSGDMTLRAKFKVREASTVYVTYYAGEHGQIKSADGSLKSVETEEIQTTGNFTISPPEIVADEGWRLTGWVNTVDGSSLDDGAKNDGKNNFSLTAVYESSAVTVTFRCDTAGAELIDPATNEYVSLLTQTIYPEEDGTLSVKFPTVVTDGTVQLDKWINTESGTAASGNGGKIEMDSTNRTMDFTATFKAVAEIYLQPTAGNGGTIESTAEIHVPSGSTVSLPGAHANDGYKFVNWYYADGTPLTKVGDNYQLDHSKGVLDEATNRLNFAIYAKFQPTA